MEVVGLMEVVLVVVGMTRGGLRRLLLSCE
jgi:hypothetical protein